MLEVLHDFHKGEVTSGTRSLLLKCPSCGGSLHAFSTYAICEHKRCKFRTGTAMDFMALLDGGYKTAVKSVLTAYPSRFAHDPDPDISQIAHQLEDRRALIQFLLEASEMAGNSMMIAEVQTAGWLRTAGIQIAAQSASCLVFSGARYKEFVKKAATAYPDATLSPLPISNSQAAVVIPLYSSPAVITGWMAYPSGRPEDVVVNWLNECRFAYTGLLDIHPHCQRIELHTSDSMALAANSVNAVAFRDRFAVCVHYRPKCSEKLWEPQEVIFHLRKETAAGLSGVAELAIGGKVSVKRADDDLLETWDDFVVRHVADAVRERRGVDAGVGLLISALRYNDHHYTSLISELQQDGKLDWAAAIERIRQTRLIHKDGSLSYYRTAHGYHVIRDDGSKVDLTNFTLELRNNVVFVDSKATCHMGVLQFQGKEYPFSLTSQQLQALSTLEDAARVSELAKPEDNPAGKLPTIRERNYARELLVYFRSISENLPRVEGLDGVGWTERRKAFMTPWGKVTAKEWNPDIRYGNPLCDFWKIYDLTLTPVPGENTTDVPVPVADLISQLVGMVGRGYADFPTKPVCLVYTPEGNYIMRNLFRALGQLEPYSFSSREGSSVEIKGCRGFPMLVTGASQGQMEKSKQALVSLSDYGQAVHCAVDDATMSRVMLMVPRIMQQCVQWIMSTQGSALKVFSSVSNSAALAREGASIIRNATGLEWPMSQPLHQTVERLLNQIPFARGTEFFTQHITNQTISIRLGTIKDVDLQDLLLEMTRECRSASIENGICTADVHSMIGLLENFYGGKTPPMNYEGLPKIVEMN